MPHCPIGDGLVHLLEKLFWVVAGVQNAMILANQFILRILTDGAELIVHIRDGALDVGNRHDGMLIQSELLIGELFERSFAGSETFLHGLFGLLALRDIGAYGYVLPRFSIRADEWHDGRVYPVN